MKAMKLLLLLLALLLASCTTTQNIPSISEAEAQAALVEVVRLSAQNLDTTALTSLPLSALLDRESAHLSEEQAIPRLPQRLEAWADEVREAFRTTARLLADEVDDLAPRLLLEDGPTMIRTKTSATSVLRHQFADEITAKGEELLAQALAPSQESWRLIRSRYEVWQHGRLLLGESQGEAVTEDLFDHLLALFTNTILDALEHEELLLRTTPVVKGSGSFLEVFQ